MARFDQQETTKFHLDGAPEQSMLDAGVRTIEGWQPVNSWPTTLVPLSILAYTPQQFLHDFNPMYKKGEELLGRYVMELPQPTEGHSRILLVNNSSLPFTEARTNPLGVMHKAIIVTPKDAERRIVNSTMLAVGGEEIGV